MEGMIGEIRMFGGTYAPFSDDDRLAEPVRETEVQVVETTTWGEDWIG